MYLSRYVRRTAARYFGNILLYLIYSSDYIYHKYLIQYFFYIVNFKRLKLYVEYIFLSISSTLLIAFSVYYSVIVVFCSKIGAKLPY